jgi:hypothetical protein
LLLTLAFAPRLAHAEISDEDRKIARAALAEGRTLRDEKKDYPAALEALKKAHSIVNIPTTGLEVTRTLVLLGRFVEAHDMALEVVNLPVTPKEPASFAPSRIEARKLADEIKLRISYIKLAIKMQDKQQPDVAVDGQSAGAGTDPIRVNPGKHKLVITGGPKAQNLEVEVSEGATKEVAVDIRPVDKPAAPPPPPPPPAEPPPSRLMRPLPLGGFAVAGVGLVAGAVTGFLTLSKASSAKDQCVSNRCPPSAHDSISSGKTMGLISTISFAVAGAGAAVGVFGYLQDPAAPEPTAARHQPRVTPWIGLGSAGLSGNF